MNATNENDPDNPLPFIQLSALVANVMAYLEGREEKKEHGDRDAGRSDADEEKEKRHRKAVDAGLKRIRAFERRAGGK